MRVASSFQNKQIFSFRNQVQQKEKLMTPNEEVVVNLSKNWRLGNEAEASNADHSEKQNKPLKKDNVIPEEVVEIIKDYHTEKITYVRLNDSASGKEIQKKMDEVKDIFYETSNGMEWEKINLEAVEKMQKELKITGMENFNQWMQKENNYLLLGKKIISLAEQRNWR